MVPYAVGLTGSSWRRRPTCHPPVVPLRLRRDSSIGTDRRDRSERTRRVGWTPPANGPVALRRLRASHRTPRRGQLPFARLSAGYGVNGDEAMRGAKADLVEPRLDVLLEC